MFCFFFSCSNQSIRHQPSSRLLDQFDHHRGKWIFSPPGFLVPYLKTVNLNCPSYTNPADFGNFVWLQIWLISSNHYFNIHIVSLPIVLDVASGGYGDVLLQLSSEIKKMGESFRKIHKLLHLPRLSITVKVIFKLDNFNIFKRF